MNPQTDKSFYTFLREERQFSFLLAFLLMQKGDAMVRFLDLIRARPGGDGLPTPSPSELDGAEVYVEYAFLRDKWDSLLPVDGITGRVAPGAREEANSDKRAYIDALLRRVPALHELADRPKPESPADFNAYFMGPAGARIERDIASPGLWSVQSLVDRFRADRDMCFDLCKLKWSFHIKPDLVVDIPGCPPICVEAKLESGEGSYPTGKEATIIDELFGERKRVKQFALQQFMFERLLSRPCLPVVVQKLYPRVPPDSPRYPILIWGEVLSTLASGGGLDGAIPFVSRLMNENATLLSSYATHRMHGGG